MLYSIVSQTTAFILLVLVVYIVAEMIRLRLHFRAGRNLAKASAPFGVHRENAKLNILIVGDSTAVGTGAYNPENTVAGRLVNKFSNINVTNLGKNGTTTASLLDTLLSLDVTLTYDVMIINVGGNDAVFLSPLDEVAVKIEDVLYEAKKRARKVFLWTGGNAGSLPAIPLIARWYFERRSRIVRGYFGAAAKKCGVVFIDLFRERKLDPIRQHPERYIAKDHFHPNDEGYSLWYDELLKEFKAHNIELS